MYLIILSFYNILTIWTINLLAPKIHIHDSINTWPQRKNSHAHHKLYNYSFLNDYILIFNTDYHYLLHGLRITIRNNCTNTISYQVEKLQKD